MKGDNMKVLLLGLTVSLTSCMGGGYGLTDAQKQAIADRVDAQVQLTDSFVNDLNASGEFTVSIAKRFTDVGYDYLVIYDKDNNSYDAIDISRYDASVDNAADYYYDNLNHHFLDLKKIPAHYQTEYNYEVVGVDEWGYDVYDYVPEEVYVSTQYWDSRSNLYFEKVSASPKDLAKVVALQEAIEIDKASTSISNQLGLSLKRSREVANLKQYWKKVDKKSMTKSELSSFTTELLGFSIDDAIGAYQASANGNDSQLEGLINQSAEVNSITPEHAQSLMSKVFGL